MNTGNTSIVTKFKVVRCTQLGKIMANRFHNLWSIFLLFILTSSIARAGGPWDPDADRDLPNGFEEAPPPELWANTIGPVFAVVLIIGLYKINREKWDIGASLFFIIMGGPVLTGAIMTPVFFIGCVWESF